MSIAVLVFGLCAALSAVAQTPALPLPSLPGLPAVPAAPTSAPSPVAALPDVKNSSASKIDAPTAAAPNAPSAPAPGSAGEPTQTAQQGSPNITPTLPTIPKVPPSDDSASFGQEAPDGTPIVPGVEVNATNSSGAGAAIPVPRLVMPSIGALTPPPVPGGALPEPQELVLEDAPPQQKSWETALEPVVKPRKSDYNYNRQLLPDLVYQTAYAHDNRHLPLRTTRDDYNALLFKSIARKDLVVMRALLNAGTSLNATNEYGETPLSFAERMGDERMVALLVARGAH